MTSKKTFFSFLSEKKPEPQKSTPVVITSYSQPHVLQQRMKEEKLTHGQTVTANLSPVRLESNFGKMVMYFCPMQNIEVINEITPGDGGSIPHEAIIVDFNIPAGTKPGLYTLENATLFSNGTMQVIANKDTVFTPLPLPQPQSMRERLSPVPAYTSSEEVREHFKFANLL